MQGSTLDVKTYEALGSIGSGDFSLPVANRAAGLKKSATLVDRGAHAASNGLSLEDNSFCKSLSLTLYLWPLQFFNAFNKMCQATASTNSPWKCKNPLGK